MNEVKIGQLEVDNRQYDAIWVEVDGVAVAKLFYVAVDQETILTNRETDKEFQRQGLQKLITEALVAFMRSHGYRYIKSSISITNLPSIANRLSLTTRDTDGVFLTKIPDHCVDRLDSIVNASQKKLTESYDFITDIDTVVQDNKELWEKFIAAQKNIIG